MRSQPRDRPAAVPPEMGRRAFLRRFASLAVIGPLAQCISETAAASADRGVTWTGIVALPVKYPGLGATLQGYLARPRGAGSYPAVILQAPLVPGEPFRDRAHNYAQAGFVALVMDPLSRQGGAASFSSLEAARGAIAALSPAQTATDLDAARAFLESHPAVRRSRIRIARTF